MTNGMRTTGLLVMVALLAPTIYDSSTGEATTSSGGDNRTSSSEECTDDRRGGELVYGVYVETPGFDPIVGGSVGAYAGSERSALFDTLMQYDVESGAFVPRLAESLEPNEDLTEWTLTLRGGVTFGNGEPFDTAAVEFTVDRFRAEDSTSHYKELASLVESMEIIDDLTIVFHLREPWGNLPSMLAGAVGMVVDPGTFEELGPERFAADPQGGGAGPYRVARYAPGEEIVLEARDDYWDGPVCIETLRFVQIADENARLDAFRNGELDVAFFRSAPQVAQLREEGFDMQTRVSNGSQLLLINHGDADGPGGDVRVRQAIAYALDPGVIDQRVTGGVGVPSKALVSDRSVLYTPALEGLPYDPERAHDLLEEVRTDTGYDGSLTLQCDNRPELVEWAITVEAMLETVGFDVTLDNSQNLGDLAQRYLQSDFEFQCNSVSMDDPQPWETLVRHLGPGNPNRYASPEMDESMAALRSAANVEDRQQALADVQNVWNETIPGVITGHTEEGPAWHGNVAGLDFSNTAIVLFDDAYLTD